METVALAGVLAALLALAVVLTHRRRVRHPLASAANEALERDLPPGVGTHLERAPEIRAVERRPDGTVVPVVRVTLGVADEPGTDLVFEYVADVLAALHPVFADERLERYDLEFTFGPDGLLVSRSSRRVCVPAEVAEAAVGDSNARALERAVEAHPEGVGWLESR
ncbi:hypothetical protein [Natronobiforma cellulositropha]|uniref:hypothetical protein n=1 Tax=Natronobiforma cellulositropha TaxID=1679076 RepID=UPI0021D5C0FE|nr:hypothetical protein [Natronobiforma cellulositropha]